MKQYWFECFVVIFLIIVGIYTSFSHNIKKGMLVEYIGNKVEVIGVISQYPDVREKNIKIVIDINQISIIKQKNQAENIKTKKQTLNKKERLIMNAPIHSEYKYGDFVIASGTLILPQNFETETERYFNYVNYLSKDKIYYQLFRPKIEILKNNNGDSLKKNLFKFHDYIKQKIYKIFDQETGGLSSGLILGEKRSLGESVMRNFNRAGLSHIVVLSGFNMTIIATFLIAILGFLGRKISAIIAILAIIFFSIMVGGGATVIRASIMSVIALVGKFSIRKYNVFRAFFLSAFVMVLFNPMILLYDPSFELSFMATFGLLIFSEKIAKVIKYVPNTFNLKETLVATISAQIAVTPLLVYLMGNFSIISLVSNILVLPVIPFAMFFSFLPVFISILLEIFNIHAEIFVYLFSFPGFLLLKYILMVTNYLGSLQFSSINIPPFSIALLFLMYLLYLPIFFFKKTKNIFLKILKTNN